MQNSVTLGDLARGTGRVDVGGPVRPSPGHRNRMVEGVSGPNLAVRALSVVQIPSALVVWALGVVGAARSSPQTPCPSQSAAANGPGEPRSSSFLPRPVPSGAGVEAGAHIPAQNVVAVEADVLEVLLVGLDLEESRRGLVLTTVDACSNGRCHPYFLFVSRLVKGVLVKSPIPGARKPFGERKAPGAWFMKYPSG